MPFVAIDPGTGERAYFYTSQEARDWCADRIAAFAHSNFNTEGDYVVCGQRNYDAYLSSLRTR